MGAGAWILQASIMMMLIAAATSSEYCNCLVHHPQTFSCQSNIAIIKGQFLNVSEMFLSSNSDYPYKGFYIKADEVFKGNISQEVFFVFNFIHPPCEFRLSAENFHRDYMITVASGKSIMYVSLCCFIKPWGQVSRGQIKGFQGGYAKECGCEVIACSKPPCVTAEKQCAIVKYDESVRLDQEQNQICAHDDQGKCAWKNI